MIGFLIHVHANSLLHPSSLFGFKVDSKFHFHFGKLEKAFFSFWQLVVVFSPSG